MLRTSRPAPNPTLSAKSSLFVFNHLVAIAGSQRATILIFVTIFAFEMRRKGLFEPRGFWSMATRVQLEPCRDGGQSANKC